MKKIKRTFNFIFGHPLAGRHPYRSIYRFLYWQLQCVISPDIFKVKTFLGGTQFYAKKGSYGLTGNIYTGLHEFEDMCFLLHFLRPGDVFFDIGANVGSYTILASGVCGATTTALEPLGLTFGYLTENIALNTLQNRTRLINAAAGAETGEISFSADEDVTNHVLTAAESGSAQVIVPVVPVDSLLDGGIPSLLKIDVEGFEMSVLKGMVRTLASPLVKAIIIELNGSGARYGFDDQAIHDLLLSLDFQAYQYDPFTRSLKVSLSYGSHNTIYCRDMEFVRERTASAPHFRIMGERI